MPGTPAAGGWGGSNRTLGIVMEGFTDQEVVVPAPPLSPHYHVRARRCRPHVLVLLPRPRLLTGVRVHTRDGQIAQAVDHCDNDKIKTIKYLNKLKGQVRPLRRGRRGLQARGKRLARGERHADEFANDFSRLGHPISREVWCTRCSECCPAARDIAI